MRTVINSLKSRVLLEVNTRTADTALTASVVTKFFRLQGFRASTLLSAAYRDGLIDRILIDKEYAYFRLETDKHLPPALGAALDRAYRATHDRRHMQGMRL